MSTDLISSKAKTLQSLLEVSKKQIEAALPKHLSPERLLRIAMTEARKNPALLECNQTSFIGAIIQTAQLGLEPGGALGHSYLVPFKTKGGGSEVQLIVGYRGMLELAYRSKNVSHVIARAVYDGDTFEYQYGLEEKLKHVPDPEANGKELTHVYAIVFLKEGGKIFDVMERKEVEASRARSKSSDRGPWVTDFEAMAKKSVVRRLFRWIPVSIELQEAVGIDEAGERGEQMNGAIIETTGTSLPATDKTAEFKSAINNGVPAAARLPEPTISEDPQNFANFGAQPGESEPTKDELIQAIIDTYTAVGISNEDFAEKIQRELKKAPQDLDESELKLVLIDLKGYQKTHKTNKAFPPAKGAKK